jgi:hypothetical protein
MPGMQLPCQQSAVCEGSSNQPERDVIFDSASSRLLLPFQGSSDFEATRDRKPNQFKTNKPKSSRIKRNEFELANVETDLELN